MVFPLSLCAQIPRSNFGKVYDLTPEEIESETEIVQLKRGKVHCQENFSYEKSDEEQFLQVRKWFVDTFIRNNSVLQIEDKAAGVLTGKAVTYFNFKSGVNRSSFALFFTVHMEIKNGNLDFSISNIYGNDTRTNNFQRAVEATNAVLNDTNFNEHNVTSNFDMDIDQVYTDYMRGKKKNIIGDYFMQ